jgi:Xaa-Pro aminopeptidase
LTDDADGKFAIDGLTISASEAILLEQKLSAKGLTFIQDMDLLSPIWKDRPKIPNLPIVDYPVLYAGLGREEKLSLVRKKLTEGGAEATLITQADDLAWCFNLRGNDIQYNPLFTGYGYIDQQHATLFVEQSKLEPALIDTLERGGVDVINYDSIFSYLNGINPVIFHLDPAQTSSSIYRHISKKNQVINGPSITTLLKSVKNEIEIEGMKQAHIRDGVAMVNFLYWFEQNFGKLKITELTIAEKLREFRSEQALYMGESFSPIIGFGLHGAIVHYSATPETDAEVLKDSILLFDSGGQYLDGTTDITRTIPTGIPTARQRSDFTLVLKGTIQLANTRFPENTKGYSLDIMARKALWDNGLNYGHGTGHGVGHFSSVHEGPMAIRQEFNGEPIRAGQVLSDEPALYRVGEYGIRTENVIVCQTDQETDFGRFLSFETITLCPIDRRLVDPELMTDIELKWLNNYHARVCRELSPKLNHEVNSWLSIQCAPIFK